MSADASVSRAARGRSAGRELRVLQSFGAIRPSTNPVCVLLLRSLEPWAEVATFSWRRALLGRYDVLHLHWPEAVVGKSTRVRTWLAAALLAATLVKFRVLGRAIVRTAHNVRPHEDADIVVGAALRLADRWTTSWIRLNDHTPVPAAAAVTTIPHGDYTPWFADVPPGPRTDQRLAFFGLVRAYKGVGGLITAFASVDGDASLVVCGRPSPAGIGDQLRTAASGDSRVRLALEHVPDDVLVAEIDAASLVVLPYRELHNSGAVLMALSRRRPVLVPRNAVTDDLAAEVGPGWVLRYEGDLDAADLRRALDECAEPPPTPPDLTARAWPRIARAHVTVYQRACAHARGRAADADEPMLR